MESTKKLEEEASEVLEMLGGFGLLSENSSETDKKAFKKSYIEYRMKNLKFRKINAKSIKGNNAIK